MGESVWGTVWVVDVSGAVRGYKRDVSRLCFRSRFRVCRCFLAQTHGVRRFIEQAAAFRGALASSSSNFGSG